MDFLDFDQKLCQVLLASPQQTLAAYQRLCRGQEQSLPGLIYIYDVLQQCTVYSSGDLLQLLGYPPDTMPAQGDLGLAQLMHPDDLAAVASYYQQFHTLTEGEVISLDYRMQRQSGAWGWLHSQDTLLARTAAGLPQQVMGLVQPDWEPLQSVSHPEMWSTAPMASTF